MMAASCLLWLSSSQYVSSQNILNGPRIKAVEGDSER